MTVAERHAEPTLAQLRAWLVRRGHAPLPHQTATWQHALAGRSGLLTVPTGMGKTWAAWFGALARALAADAADGRRGLRVLWLTPLRALARDLTAALQSPVIDLALPATVELRTGDSAAAAKRRQDRRPPTAMVTTPESLSVLLARADSVRWFADLDTVVLDEWHELLASKRGTQVELALARLRQFRPRLCTWALSATLADPERALAAAVGATGDGVIVTSERRRTQPMRTLLPPNGAPLPMFGWLGTAMVDVVVNALDPERSTLVFTNTRHQAEHWYHAILERRPEWFPHTALHHGSLAAAARTQVEHGLARGGLKLVVCTSSLDLGVDFGPVDRVLQIGSPRGVARLLQRAGRAGHRPDAQGELWLVPTHALQLVEFAGLFELVAAGAVEERPPREQPLDVLAQHLVTVALGGGFEPDALFAEVRTAHAYRHLDRPTFDAVLQLVERGGQVLADYPQFRRVVRQNGRCVVTDRRVARLHRLAIGTITQDGMLAVRYRNGQVLGQVEEQFIARLQRGDRFVFAGRTLSLVTTADAAVVVAPARGAVDHAPKWVGGRMPVSTTLNARTRAVLAEVRAAVAAGKPLARFGPEIEHLAPLLRRQARVGVIPGNRTLAEVTTTREGEHLFLFPFGGQLAHHGLAVLLAWRLGQRCGGATFALSVDDYGLELQTWRGFDFAQALAESGLWSAATLATDLLTAVHAAELTRRHFREVARIAGLIHERRAGERQRLRQLQASAGLLHDVLQKHEPDHLLLRQARAEVLAHGIDEPAIGALLTRIAAEGVEIVRTARPSPLAFPLLLDRVDGRVSNESMAARLARVRERWLAAEAGDGESRLEAGAKAARGNA
jgi:ATP-dependent helicase Lhr and Lhr-like helicase